MVSVSGVAAVAPTMTSLTRTERRRTEGEEGNGLCEKQTYVKLEAFISCSNTKGKRTE